MASKRSRKRRKARRRPQGPNAGGAAPGPREDARAAGLAGPEPPAPAGGDAARARAARRRAAPGGPPPPPWGSFPLSELVIGVALVMLVAGFFVGPPRGPVLLGTGLVLGSLAGLELAVREHFSGYRSHTMLLAGAAGIATVAMVVAAAGAAPAFGAAAGALVFAAAAYLLTGAFRRRSGGALFKVKGS